MSLHTAGKQADYESIPPIERNIFQRVAARTNGWVTPGNFISFLGAGLTLSANLDIRKKHYARAAAKMFAGRVLDMVDGKVADMTGTKGPIGEGVDASLDKFLALVTVLNLHNEGIITRNNHDTVIAQQGLSFMLSVAGKVAKREIHPSRAGKEDMTAVWTNFGSSLLERTAKTYDMPVVGEAFHDLSDLALFLSRNACSPVTLKDYTGDLIPFPKIGQTMNAPMQAAA